MEKKNGKTVCPNAERPGIDLPISGQKNERVNRTCRARSAIVLHPVEKFNRSKQAERRYVDTPNAGCIDDLSVGNVAVTGGTALTVYSRSGTVRSSASDTAVRLGHGRFTLLRPRLA